MCIYTKEPWVRPANCHCSHQEQPQKTVLLPPRSAMKTTRPLTHKIFPLLVLFRNELMQPTPSQDHWQHRDLSLSTNLQQSGTVCVNKPFQGINHFLWLTDSTMVHTHCFCQFYKVRVLLVGVCISILVEKILPLCNHSLFLIIQENDLYTDLELCGCG